MATISNAPESEALSSDDVEIFENARQAVMTLKKTFETWMVIAKAIVWARNMADRRGGRKTFMRIVEQQGLGRVVDKATASRLLRIHDHLGDVYKWRETLTEKQQLDWASPTSVCQRCPTLNPPKDRGEPKPPKMMVDKAQYTAMLEENDQLKKREDGDRFRPEDSAHDIAVTMVGMFSPRKAKEIAKQMMELVKKREPQPVT
jgi:hypothetical protein